ncbi:2Fe-2S iron-sulfur cluster-binding protein [Bacillus tuaregi]|uniref:2Fe-2S iron-sulfur cluster-binding protein n=1 Tax=Bacillus tuaregi TaxID=1816695 RepID=UPI0008F88648|nr:2Fe-2S iron-sulfur cluster-binding protein [Bacillus tuaregi]
MFNVKLYARGQEFNYACSTAVTPLQAARDQFIPIPTGCRRGGCGLCKVKVMEGKFNQEMVRSHEALSDAELANGYALACCMVPESDLNMIMAEEYVKQEKVES